MQQVSLDQMDSSPQITKVNSSSAQKWISKADDDDRSFKKESKKILHQGSPAKNANESAKVDETSLEESLVDGKEKNISTNTGENQDILDQMEGFTDFSKLVEVIRTKYVKEEHFTELKSDASKIKFIITQPSVTDAFDAYIKSIVCSTSDSSKKSLEKANEFRMDGNKYFKNKKYSESLKLYSRAILYAPSESSELPQLFANRSASLFYLNQFTDCLADTQFALDHANYPSGQRYTLLLRKALCLKALKRTVEAQASLKEALDDQPVNIQRSINAIYDQFSSESHEESQASPAFLKNESGDSPFKSTGKLANASDAVKLVYTDEKGHHLKSTRNLNRDELIIREKPYASILNSQFFDSFCQNCCIELKSNIYPCAQCCNVSYCSVKCQQEAWNTFHKSECNLLPVVLSMGVLRLSLRILLITGVEEALKVNKDLLSRKDSNGESSHLRLDKDKSKRENNYRAICTLCDPSDSLNYLVSSRQAIASAFMLHLLTSKYIGVVDSSLNEQNYWTLGGLLLKHTHQISVNSIVLFHQPILPGPHGINGIDIRSQSIGTAIYSTVSLMNHSCIPNTELFYHGSLISVKSKCSINAGDEITCTYGPLFRKMTRAERIETLSSQYYFKCSCGACNEEQIYTKNNIKYHQSADEEDNRLPILAECFICPSCSGPMVINGSTEGRCLTCHLVTNDLKEILDKLDSGKKLINVSKALLQFGRPSECEKNLLKALNVLSKICWPTNRFMLNLYNELINIYTSVNGFDGSLEQGKKYIEISNKIKSSTYGCNSFEYLHGLLQLLNLRWTQLTSNSSRSNAQPSASINKKLLARLITESNSLITLIHSSLNANKIANELLVLDSSVISCLKELVQLEKSVKQHSK